MDTHSGPPRREWRTLSDRQREIAADLTARAQQMWADADGEISLREAVELAAFQAGYQSLADTK